MFKMSQIPVYIIPWRFHTAEVLKSYVYITTELNLIFNVLILYVTFLFCSYYSTPSLFSFCFLLPIPTPPPPPPLPTPVSFLFFLLSLLCASPYYVIIFLLHFYHCIKLSLWFRQVYYLFVSVALICFVLYLRKIFLSKICILHCH